MSIKEKVLETVQEMPDDVTYDDILERLSILAAIREGEEAYAAGHFVSLAEVKKRIDEWNSKSS